MPLHTQCTRERGLCEGFQLTLYSSLSSSPLMISGALHEYVRLLGVVEVNSRSVTGPGELQRVVADVDIDGPSPV